MGKRQLMMIRKLDTLPELVLPKSYSIRSFEDGDSEVWDYLVEETFGKGLFTFHECIEQNPAFKKKNVLFVCYKDEVVGTATAWYEPRYGESTGYLHVVGVISSHSGKGLGYSVSLAALYRMKQEGKTYAVLNTDDHRIPAIKTYIKLGFEPVIYSESDRERWRKLQLEKVKV